MTVKLSIFVEINVFIQLSTLICLIELTFGYVKTWAMADFFLNYKFGITQKVINNTQIYYLNFKMIFFSWFNFCTLRNFMFLHSDLIESIAEEKIVLPCNKLDDSSIDNSLLECSRWIYWQWNAFWRSTPRRQ